MPLITNVVRGSNADRLLLLVHGFGADERDLGGLLPYLDPEGRFVTVLPRGPVGLPGMPGFPGLPPGALDQLPPGANLPDLSKLNLPKGR